MCTSLFLNPLIPLRTRAKSWFSPLGISTLSTGGRKLSTGIPGLDESYLPRWMGLLGLSLAGFSIVLPYFGKFLKLISFQDALCVRGYWNMPRDVSKVDALDWFHTQIQRIGLSDLKETLYFPQSADSELWEILPRGTRSRLVQPVQQAPAGSANQVEKTEGFVIVASSIDYAYSDKDRAWIGAVANKFRGKHVMDSPPN